MLYVYYYFVYIEHIVLFINKQKFIKTRKKRQPPPHTLFVPLRIKLRGVNLRILFKDGH